jgi:hypothetical protein
MSSPTPALPASLQAILTEQQTQEAQMFEMSMKSALLEEGFQTKTGVSSTIKEDSRNLGNS